jgi:anti-sigma factor ChrR (cupin superfamily)
VSNLRSDVRHFEVAHTDEMPWASAPVPNVWRKRLELSGPPEAGRVTSIVRYAPGSQFPSHPHPDGEEILVLDGVFSDEHGDFPAGTFLLNPTGFEHAPFSRAGCTLFVKLRQSPGARQHVVVDTTRADWHDHPTPGVAQLPLYFDPAFPERIHLTRIAPGVSAGPVHFPAGEEILVLEGAFRDEHGSYRVGSWVRYPPGSSHTLTSASGCRLYVKQGHLLQPFPD